MRCRNESNVLRPYNLSPRKKERKKKEKKKKKDKHKLCIVLNLHECLPTIILRMYQAMFTNGRVCYEISPMTETVIKYNIENGRMFTVCFRCYGDAITFS